MRGPLLKYQATIWLAQKSMSLPFLDWPRCNDLATGGVMPPRSAFMNDLALSEPAHQLRHGDISLCLNIEYCCFLETLTHDHILESGYLLWYTWQGRV